MTLTCATCGYISVHTWDKALVAGYGYEFHKPCLDWHSPGVVAFPSRGKMLRDTMRTPDEEQSDA